MASSYKCSGRMDYHYCYQNQWICTEHTCLIEPEFINFINTGDYGWKADNYSQFWGMTLREGFEYRLGTKSPSPLLLSMNEMTHRVSPDEEFPEFFIASYKWPDYIHRPLDQKNCAASWAFSTASVAADRVAIHSQGLHTANLSPQDLISCNVHNQYGCRGGHIDGAWWFLRKRGLVSHECFPYEMDDNTNAHNTCNISSITDQHGKSHATEPCPNRLESSNYLYQCSPPYRIPSNEREIMMEIMENGPVQAIMTVHEDFFLYKTGIYKYTGISENKSEINDIHSVKIVGWGALRRPSHIKFWIVANSWGSTWGENGYFRIVRGKNECEIEKLMQHGSSGEDRQAHGLQIHCPDFPSLLYTAQAKTSPTSCVSFCFTFFYWRQNSLKGPYITNKFSLNMTYILRCSLDQVHFKPLFEGSQVARTKLVNRDPEADVPGGEPNSVPRNQDRRRPTFLVRLDFHSR
ncbi:tubulointerstitial nephritis antigen [Hyla sarda]|uniref:tubulointerstitial nephritis antigen n=1 Tax=Hyla sarda TaxID=327740 RepID=UPI0024C43922|nr:tubulointerstitial nephritis antigen [Hyla sarda]